jgi:hypothetical protein
MYLDTRELNDLTRRATELMSETADVPRVLRNQLGENHELAQAAEAMQGSIENFVRELRCWMHSKALDWKRRPRIRALGRAVIRTRRIRSVRQMDFAAL